IHRGTGAIPPVTFEETRELQQLLIKQGHDVGGSDGKLGSSTRAAIRAMQIKLGLPADAYPTPELLQRMRSLRYKPTRSWQTPTATTANHSLVVAFMLKLAFTFAIKNPTLNFPAN